MTKHDQVHHVAHLYAYEDEQRSILSEFIQRSLADKARVLCLGRRPDEVGEVTAIHLDDEGVTDPGGLSELLKREVDLSRDAGCPVLNLSVEMAALMRTSIDVRELLEYETVLDELCAGDSCRIMCQYDRREFRDTMLLAAVAAHSQVVIGKQVCWNPHFIPSRDLHEHGHAQGSLQAYLGTLSKLNQFAEDLDELKTPLFAMSGFLSMLERDIAARDKTYIEADLLRISEAVDKMERLVTGKPQPPKAQLLEQLNREYKG